MVADRQVLADTVRSAVRSGRAVVLHDRPPKQFRKQEVAEVHEVSDVRLICHSPELM